uniref:Helicase-associated domain-containing protein n=1 Tax=Odontella aurita TaxID=265563 RepID=A0A6U6FJ73_9STRA|mmetsp:Transcript_35711/g.106583  ORF Transcript_35711/g.106583 Transcript_35711/m.106583 type:complete len:403 (+) Transcript_35711:623-1831(+)
MGNQRPTSCTMVSLLSKIGVLKGTSVCAFACASNWTFPPLVLSYIIYHREVRYQELCRYKQQVGNCMVPIGFKKNKQLSNWVSTQRQEMKLMKQGRPSRLTEERTLRLNDIGFVWEAQRGGAKPKKKAAEEERHKSASTLIGPVVTIKTLLSCGCSPLLSSAVPFPSAPREPISNESTLWSIKQRSHHVTDVGMYLSRGYSTNCCCVAELGEDALDTDQYTVCSHQGCTTNIKTPSGALTIDPTINPCNSVCQNSDRRQPTEGQQGIFDDAEEAEDLRADMAIQAYLKNKRRYKDGIFTSDNSQTPALYQPKTMNSRNSWENSLLPADMVDRSDTVGGVVMKAGHASSCSKASLAVSVGVGDRVDHNNASMYRPNHNSDRVRREVAATLLSVSGGKANFSKH